ncbi:MULTISPECIES: hypothetical protein [unclassified Nocardioides]|uniref:hypothetical protein n=1 Tax=unclassified Nocardioides TaxID=2615069 RepID=UPI0009F0F5B3|nr:MULTISPECIES: hypothetical protein [unclassified Nocardioides]GAW49402.1 uncharacterized protein PD653B2_1724 [Nocardioides sp. PD653-B2]GAW55084.1 uncharacterized protein PD653_2503 [Nocardioides sp. PD653]
MALRLVMLHVLEDRLPQGGGQRDVAFSPIFEQELRHAKVVNQSIALQGDGSAVILLQLEE